MPVLSVGLAVGALAVSAAGVGVSYAASKANQKAQETIVQNQQVAEDARQKQLNLDATRRKREIIRQSIAARSMALTQTTAQKAQYGSALPGAYGSISGRTGVNTLGVGQNQELGNTIFGANQGVLSGYRQAAAAGSLGALGGGMTSLGGAVLNNLGAITKIGTYVSTPAGAQGGGMS